MMLMSLRELNANVSQAVAKVAAGETIDITKHGRPVARISPIEAVAEGRRASPNAVDAVAEGRPERGTPEWQAAYDRMMALMEKGYPLGVDRVAYEDKHA